MSARYRHHLACVLRAEASGRDRIRGPFGLHIQAMRADGSLYQLGSVSDACLGQDPEGAEKLIQRLKFNMAEDADTPASIV